MSCARGPVVLITTEALRQANREEGAGTGGSIGTFKGLHKVGE